MSIFKRKKKIDNKPLTQENSNICMKCRSVECSFCSKDIFSAVELLKEKVHLHFTETQQSVWYSPKERYEKDMEEIIESCFPALYKKRRKRR